MPRYDNSFHLSAGNVYYYIAYAAQPFAVAKINYLCLPSAIIIFYCMQINLFSCLRQYNQSAMCHKESALHILLHCSTVNRQYGPVFLRTAAMQKRKAVLLCGLRILLRCPYSRGEPWRKHTGHILRLCIKAAAPGILCKTRCILILFSKASI